MNMRSDAARASTGTSESMPDEHDGHSHAHREDLAIGALIEKICAIDGCTRSDALRQILAFEKAVSEL